MIFVTVGTHEQPFNRLIEYMDEWAKNNAEKVIVQTGFSSYEPKYCKWKKLFTYQEMVRGVERARIVITHGGPSSFIMPMQIGKVPIVVPRKKEYEEHVNDHQVEFCNQVKKRYGNIIVVDDISVLGKIIEDYENITSMMDGNMNSNNDSFCKEFRHIVKDLLG